MEFENNEIEALEAELCDINLTLSLYLNAGLVLGSALLEMAVDYGKRDSPGARLLSRVKSEALSKNVSFETALFSAAKEIRSKVLLRFSLLLLDGRNKGSELCDRLERERMQMMSGRLSDARARANRVEAKLCSPLVLLLIALVAVCIAPALMNI